MQINEEEERKQILSAYKGLLRAFKVERSREDTRIIRKAFDFAVNAHRDMRRKSGEPYIFHPIAVARICAEEIGLGATSVVCALLHDVVEDTDVTLDDIEALFGEKVRRIIDGLTKISGVFDLSSSDQAENFKKMLLTLPDDVRVILIKLADRMHNMRTMDSMRKDKQHKIASETSFLYAPLAHRLGLYAIKTELEDLALKYTDPETYQEIITKLEKTQDVRNRFIRKFIMPIRKELDEFGLNYEIKSRTKSIFSIWNKIHKKKVPFEEIYDLFAIRIIVDTPLDREKSDCWGVYSIVTDYYKPNPERLRDWISTPKSNGYESLHTTVMSPTGKWVEVQIRTRRMDEIAEMGFAAHWKYKESNDKENKYDQWLNRIREMLEGGHADALDFIDDFKLSLLADEIFIFTPQGELKTLPSKSTALDFAFEIHTGVGEKCLGAKVNNKLVPLSHELKSGDQVEIITSAKQKPKEDWLNYVVTSKAKNKIKSALKEERRKVASQGKEILQRKLERLKVELNESNVNHLLRFYDLDEATELYFQIALGKIDLSVIKSIVDKGGKLNFQLLKEENTVTSAEENVEGLIKRYKGRKEDLIIGDNMSDMNYKLAPCCNPLPGDDVFGFITVSEGIKVHRVSCPNAQQLLANYAYRIIRAQWKSQKLVEFLCGIQFTGIDNMGLVNKITNIISQDLRVNMRSISFESKDGIFEGKITAYVHDKAHLESLMKKLQTVEGIETVERVDS
ncbi:MAG: RelA/SpoT family protein [Flavobacteriales bacterium]